MKQNPVLYWVSVAVCAASLFLVIGNALLVNGNKALQRDINVRQQQINAGQTFGQIYQGLVQALAVLRLIRTTLMCATSWPKKGLNSLNQPPHQRRMALVRAKRNPHKIHDSETMMQNLNSSGQTNACGSSCAEALPFAILALAVMLSLMLQLQQSLSDRTTLQQVRDGQTQALTQSKDVQDRLDRLAVATVRLADAGNANAKILVERMKQAGITVNPNKNQAAPDVSASTPAEPSDKK